ncbi:MAG: NAD-dependent epimerase/dehydratase family protein, partial [Chloroflexi bacterium]|nr:NAD-dependent epimerase/dehydratase family protein [Chloroflexota bacterium]
SAAFVATGQTGIMLEGGGIAIDHVVADFMAGASEQLAVEASEKADWVFVEGQGSLLHPGYSGVTLALLHGSSPDGLILVHEVGRETIEGYQLPIPPLERLVAIYEEAACWVKPAPVAGIALNTRRVDEREARAAIAQAERRTGLPATDPIRFGGGKLVEAVLQRLGPGVSGERREPWSAISG